MTTGTRLAVLTALAALLLGMLAVPAMARQASCDPAYPGVCIPPRPPDLDCGDIKARDFKVEAPDPHHFDGDHDGVGCETKGGGGSGGGSRHGSTGGSQTGAAGGSDGGGTTASGGTSGATAETGGGQLPFTGSNTTPLLAAGLLLVSVGGLLAWRMRSRPQR